MSTHATLALDARCAQYRGSGVATYGKELVEALVALDDSFRFVFLIDESLPTEHIAFPGNSRLLAVPFGRRSLARDWYEQIMLPRLLVREGVELFHGLDYVAPVSRTPFAKVVTFQDATVFTPLDGRAWLRKARLRWWLRRIARACDCIISPSGYAKAQVEHFIPAARGKVQSVSLGVGGGFLKDYDGAHVGPCLQRAGLEGRGSRYVLYYGGYAPHKRVSLLVRAFAQLQRTHDVRLVLVGSAGDARRRVEAEVAALGVREATTMFGYATIEEQAILLDHCSAFVCPSAMEGFGLPLCEAMSRGAAVVSSRCGSLPEVGGDAVLYFDGDDPASLSAAMARVLSEPSLSSRLRAASRERSRLFRWASTVEQLGRVYERTLSAH